MNKNKPDPADPDARRQPLHPPQPPAQAEETDPDAPVPLSLQTLDLIVAGR